MDFSWELWGLRELILFVIPIENYIIWRGGANGVEEKMLEVQMKLMWSCRRVFGNLRAKVGFKGTR